MDPPRVLTLAPPDQLLRPIGSHATGTSDASIRRLDGTDVCWIDLVGDDAASLAPSALAIAARAVDEAWRCGLPLVIRFSSVSSNPGDGVWTLHEWGRLAHAVSAASGVVPTIGILDGAVASGMSLLVGLLDVVVMVEGSRLYISGPAAVAAMTGTSVDPDELGGTPIHTDASGVAHLVAGDLDDATAWVAELLALLPPNNAEPPPATSPRDPTDRPCQRAAEAVPDDGRSAYDVRDVLTDVLDDGDLVELRGRFGPAIVCALGRLGGHPVGVVANQPAHLAGAIDIPSSQKAARFVQWCDAFGLPIVTFVDTPGYLPGRDIESDGIIRHGGQLAFAYAAASVPRLCVILRKAFGGAFIVMDSKTMGNDLCVAWPGAEIAVMGAAGAVQILEGRRLAALDAARQQAERAVREAAYSAAHLNPNRAAARGDVDAVIDPTSTRAVLCAALPSLLGKRRDPIVRKHRNGPL